jgi:hypothetical protein
MSSGTETAPTLAEIAARIESMEAQLAELKEQVRRLQEPKPVRTFGDLYGILKGQIETTEEEIDAARLQVDDWWLDEDPADGSQ